MNYKKFHNKTQWIEESVAYILSTCKKKRQPTYIGFSGGYTPIPIYHTLASVLPDYVDDVNIKGFLVDERYVPADDKESNQRMIQQELLAPLIQAGGSNTISEFSFFDTKKPTNKAVKLYKKYVAQDIIQDTFDLIILGIGTDGHTASLFPHDKALTTIEPVAHTRIHNQDRLTMTFQTIMRAKHILLLVSGKEKALIMQKLLNGDDTVEELPAKQLLTHPNLTIHYLQ